MEARLHLHQLQDMPALKQAQLQRIANRTDKVQHITGVPQAELLREVTEHLPPLPQNRHIAQGPHREVVAEVVTVAAVAAEAVALTQVEVVEVQEAPVDPVEVHDPVHHHLEEDKLISFSI